MSDASLFVRCDCDSPEHMLIFDVWHWDTERPQHSELMVHYGLDEVMPWWKRLFFAAQFVATGKTQKWWWAETVVKDRDATAMRDFLNDYLAASLNRARDAR